MYLNFRRALVFTQHPLFYAYILNRLSYGFYKTYRLVFLAMPPQYVYV